MIGEIGYGSAIASLGGARALTSTPENPSGLTPELQTKMAPIGADYTEAKTNGAQIFSQFAMNNVTTDDIDKQLADIDSKKATAYADMVKYMKQSGSELSPAQIHAYVSGVKSQLDNQASLLIREKSARLQKAEQIGESEYQSLSSSFMDARRKQMSIDQQILDESTKPQTDPDKIVELKAQKEEIDKKVETIKKDFSKKGVNEPDAILNQGDQIEQDIKDYTAKGVAPGDMKPLLDAKYPDQQQAILEKLSTQKKYSIDNLLYNTALGQYDDAQGQFDAKTFLADTQKVPEYAGLTAPQISEKLIQQDNDINSLGDIFYVTTKLNTKPTAMVSAFEEKLLDEDQIADIVLNGYLRNDPVRDPIVLQGLIKSLYKEGIARDAIKQVIEDNGYDVDRDGKVTVAK